jgi:hypothetical protein
MIGRAAYLTTLLALGTIAGANASVRVVVIDRITGEGIEGINVFLADGAHDLAVGTTDEKGVAESADERCQARFVKIESIDDNYPSPTHMAICRDPEVKIPLQSKASENQILATAFKAEAAGKHAVAAQAFSDVYSTTADAKAKEALLKSVGAYFKLPADKAIVNDPAQGEVVASPTLNNHVKAFQAKHAIDATGNLDSKTLRVMARGTFSQNVLGAVK